jgi:predicted NUDIX family NTP pyrophosphohydrolase
MGKKSAGILLYRVHKHVFEVMLVHPGGPFWKNKDDGAWSIPKGEYEEGEDPLDAAKREIKEETGIIVSGEFLKLTPLKQKSGKIIYAWALQQDADVSQIMSNSFELEWPPKSGQKILIPEIDKAEWFSLENATKKIIPGQIPFLQELEIMLDQKS